MSKAIIIGSGGLVGSSLVRHHRRNQLPFVAINRSHVDLLDPVAVDEFFCESVRPDDTVYLAAAIVGGIEANRSRPVEFIQDNLAIQHNVMSAAMRVGDHGPKRFVFLGSVCIYPRKSTVNISENEVLAGPLEPSNQSYAIAKIAGITACQAYHQERGLSYVAPMPCNLYGPGDNYHPKWAHAVPGLIQRMHKSKVSEAETFTCWGTGQSRRQFLFVDDLVEATVRLSGTDFVGHINVSSEDSCSILELANLIKATIQYEGLITLDTSKPDGAPCRTLDVSLLRRVLPDWRELVPLTSGLWRTYQSFLEGDGRNINLR